MTHFILCSGMARHGKDTSAEFIKENLEEAGYSVLITHYADLLKFICKNFFGWNGEKDEAGRTLLQKIGTDCIRSQNPDYWVNFIVNLVKMFPNRYDFIIIPDTRFPNEIERIQDAGFDVAHIRVVRNEFTSALTDEQKQHPSETALDGTIPDYWLYNSTLEQLKNDVKVLCEVITSNKSPEYVQLSVFDNPEATT